MAAKAKPATKKSSVKKAAPKSSKAAKSASTETTKVTAPKIGSDEFKAPTAKQVVDLVKLLKNLDKTAAEASGEIGNAVAKAVETKHFDKTALGIARRLEAMSDNKLQNVLPHLLKYIDDLGLGERAERQAQMFAQAKADAAAAKDEEGGGDKGGGSGGETKPRKATMRIVPKDDEGDDKEQAASPSIAGGAEPAGDEFQPLH